MVIDIKGKLFLDADGVIVNLIKAVVDCYNEDFSSHPDYVPVNWYDIETWDFRELSLTTKKKIYSYFDSERFFDKLEFLENAYEVINRLSENFDIYIVTMGSKKNLELKEKWFKKHLPFVTFIGCDTSKYKYKSHIDMSNGAFVEDRADNLENSNAAVKILYGDIYEWNCKWNGIRCFNWYEVEKLLIDLINT